MKTEPRFLVAISLLASGVLTHAQTTAPPVPAPPAPLTGTAPPPGAAPSAPVPEFHDALAPHGTWTQLAPYGEVWVPRDMPAGWRPYTTGHWVFTDNFGWTWIADEPWGWAPFHYGRWTLDATLGWVWIPGTVWGPAWVAWREGDGVTGWAPLPPCAGWSVGIGLTLGGADLALAIADPWWSFVPVGCLGHPHVREVIFLPEHCATVVHQTKIVRNIFIEHGRVANRAVQVATVEKAAGAPVQHVILHEVARPESLSAATLGPNEVAIYRPRPRVGTKAVASSPPAAPTVHTGAAASKTASAPAAPAAALAAHKEPPQPLVHRAHHRHPPEHHLRPVRT